MIKISFEAATPAALRSIIADYLGADAPAHPAQPGDEPARRPRKPKVVEPAPAPEATEAPETAQETSAAPAPVEAPAPTVEAPAPAPSGQPTRLEVQQALVQVVKEFGREVCGELCRKHGGPNLSSLSPSEYGSLLADALQMLTTKADGGNG